MFPYPFSFLGTTESGLDQLDNDYYMDFDGVDDYMTTNIVNPIAGTSDFTISCWIKSTATGVYGNYMWATACAIWGVPSQAFGILLRTPYGTTDLKVCVGSGSFGSTIVNDGDWHHVMSVWEYAQGTAGRISYYIDGNTTAEVAVDVVSYWPDHQVMPTPMIGHTAYTSGTYIPFEGFIDEWAWWNSNQSSNVQEIYDATDIAGKKCADLSSMTTPPVAWYRMGD